MTQGVLVVGYGNALRTDDGIGWHAADRLADDPRLDGATVLRRHQLTPELAFDVSEATMVVLVDARHGPPAGTISVEQISPREPRARGDDAATTDPAGSVGTTWSHHLGPTTLVALAGELYGQSPEVFVVSCGTHSLEMGERLSPLVQAALPLVVDAVADLVASHAAALHHA